MAQHLTVVGGGFAGVEAAWAAAQRGCQVTLVEMRPVKPTPAHRTEHLAELVCSNSFKSNLATSPSGQLKAEMRALGSLVLEVAARHAVPAGEALAVERDAFAAEVTQKIEEHPGIAVVRREFEGPDIELAAEQGRVVLSTGPLTSPSLASWLAATTGQEQLHFYDAVSPTVDASTIDLSIAFAQSRYDKGGDDYLNCPFNKEEYEAFVAALLAAERAPIHAFEGESEEDLVGKIKYFAGCTPIEAIAEKGARSLAFGNFKPVGLTDPRTGRRPWAALQLRPENREKTLYSLVACQTRLKWGEQKKLFQRVPGLQNAEFVRYGVIHKNTYVNAPQVLDARLELRSRPGVALAGQITGVEGYLESAATGILAGLYALGVASPPRETALGSLMAHLQDQTPREFAPMNTNWGLFPLPELQTRDKGVKRQLMLEAANRALYGWLEELA